ncbi:similar to Saccharomyces cerevisiae YOL011W PLB3 Phospholipase B (lysophospholipase) involved in phospholipid metabolism [Maudiozyma saulgeensis]|uniref:Lysophospholipase n=1 Tax=Maudiozyma saulgeensis TaxID=1789683 RepID=A0A1X7R342_9SACH|nr:similar to Saccharomyces cerevisiae YOL011W PLB3 Phospholipase B (lysophospholipase) involved in phospholipid metabolism [Kazachstania saulgeensis]
MLLKDLILSATLVSLVEVANAWSPTNGYAPATVDCDKNINLTRAASGLSESESSWLQKKDASTKEALLSFLTRSTTNFTDTSLLDALFKNSSDIPRVGIAASGGGYRAMFGGAGMVAAMDNRTEGANEYGLGGLLQGTTYLSALSGGSWFASTIVFNNWTSVQEIVDQMSDTNNSIWNTAQSPFTPGGTNNTITTERYANITSAVNDKYNAGFPVSLADVWGLAFAYSFFPTLPQGGVGYTWSTLQEIEQFTNAEMPFLIELTKVQKANGDSVDLNSPTVEINPFEIGSWDPSINGFSEVKYLGTNVSNGIPIVEGKCVEGFDNVDFFFGTSSNLIEYIDASNVTTYKYLINELATLFLGNQSTSSTRDMALYSPNPFKGTSFYDKSNGTVSEYVTDEELLMIDGGSDGQTIPFTPLMRKERNVDVVFALDYSSDGSDSYPNGLSVVNSYERQFLDIGKNEAFPYVPGVDAFVELGLNKRPVFFGCNSTNLTDLAYIPPLVVYLPNAEYSYASNVSTFQQSFDVTERKELIQNAFEAATMGNMTKDPEFLSCIGCAVMRRKQEQQNLTWPEECEKCFSKYCWDGSLSKSTSVSNTTSSTSNNVTYSNATGISGTTAVPTADISSSVSSVVRSASATASSNSSTSARSTNFGTGLNINRGFLLFSFVNIFLSII